jgi:hypothetical protein
VKNCKLGFCRGWLTFHPVQILDRQGRANAALFYSGKASRSSETPRGQWRLKEAPTEAASYRLVVFFSVFFGDDFGFFAGLIARVVMVFSFRFFARLILVRILVIGHLVLL